MNELQKQEGKPVIGAHIHCKSLSTLNVRGSQARETEPDEGLGKELKARASF